MKSELSRKFSRAEANKEIEADLNETLTALRRNYKLFVEDEARVATEKVQTAAAELEMCTRLAKELEGRCEQAVMNKDRLELELKMQRDAYRREVELLRSSETMLKKAIEKLQAEGSEMATEVFELRVGVL